MTDDNASAQLDRASELRTRTSSRAARWYVGYLIVYGVASFALAATYGFAGSSVLTTALTMPLWVIIVIGLSVWAARQRSTVRGFGWIHGGVIGVWGAAWALTVGFGTTVFSGRWEWFVGGGTVMAAAAFVGAYITYRRGKG